MRDKPEFYLWYNFFMNSDDQPLTKKDFDKTIKVFQNDFDKNIKALQETLVGGMNQILTTLIDHMDKRFGDVDERFDRIEHKFDNVTDGLTERVSKLEQRI